jgi:hypothetical protein
MRTVLAHLQIGHLGMIITANIYWLWRCSRLLICLPVRFAVLLLICCSKTSQPGSGASRGGGILCKQEQGLLPQERGALLQLYSGRTKPSCCSVKQPCMPILQPACGTGLLEFLALTTRSQRSVLPTAVAHFILQTTIVVTNKRVLLLSQRLQWGKPVSGLEESFHIEDLKVSWHSAMLNQHPSWLPAIRNVTGMPCRACLWFCV